MSNLVNRQGECALGKWRIDTLIGVGGMCSVYAATHRTNGKRAAVKVLHAHLMSVSEAVSRFAREGMAANRVDHPSIVGVFDEGALEDGTPCIVMERLNGMPLDACLERGGPLSVHESLTIAWAILTGLSAAHAAGVLHRDIKPDNVFLTDHGQLKLLDFGIARIQDEAKTIVGTVLGTPAYMSPEQAQGKWDEVDVRTDIFAVGALMLELLVGERPRQDETANLVLAAAMRKPLRGVGPRGLSVPSAIAAHIDRAIAFSRDARWRSAIEMRDALEEAWTASGGEPLRDSTAVVGRLLRRAQSTDKSPPKQEEESEPVSTEEIAALAGHGASVEPQIDPASTHVLGGGAGLMASQTLLALAYPEPTHAPTPQPVIPSANTPPAPSRLAWWATAVGAALLGIAVTLVVASVGRTDPALGDGLGTPRTSPSQPSSPTTELPSATYAYAAPAPSAHASELARAAPSPRPSASATPPPLAQPRPPSPSDEELLLRH